MKKFFLGIMIGFLLGGGVVFAASKYVFLRDSTGVAISSSNPLPILNN